MTSTWFLVLYFSSGLTSIPAASFEACQTAGLAFDRRSIRAACVNTTTGEVVTIAN